MSKKIYQKSIFIFRRDLRLDDNTGLIKCLEMSKSVIPLFIFTNEQILHNDYKSNKCVKFMVNSLDDLSAQLAKKKAKLNYFYGDNIKVIQKILGSNNIDAIFVNQDYTPYSTERDKLIMDLCNDNNIAFNSYEDILLNPINSIQNGSGSIFVKFTPYFNRAKSIPINKPTKNKYTNYSKLAKVSTKKFKLYDDENLEIEPGRKGGVKILKNISLHKDYNTDRNKLCQSTTNLSAYIKFGCLSIREVYYIIRQELGVKNDLIKQLYWRDFYYNIAYSHPEVFSNKGALKPIYNNIKWESNKAMAKKWMEGKTGFPIVDAGMIEMNTTGFMHNRARLIVASFLVKLMLVNWKVGEKYFAQKLVDYDPCVNNGNWQWVAGSGADAQPYFRIFNPWAQSKTHDPDCKYIKKWLPALKDVDNKHIHEWDIYHSHYDVTYPSPILDYKECKQKALDAYKKIYS